MCLSHNAHIYPQTPSHVYTYMCTQRSHLLPAVKLQAVPCIQTPRENTSCQHPYTRTQSQRPKCTTVQRSTCEHTTPVYPESCTHSYSHMCTQYNHPQSTHLHTCFHTHVLIHRLSSEEGRFRSEDLVPRGRQIPCNTSSGPSRSQPLPPSHRGLG